MDLVTYYDNNGEELHEGDFVSIHGGEPVRLYLTSDGELGRDATNPLWVESGRAGACEYGIYVLTGYDLSEIVKIDQ